MEEEYWTDCVACETETQVMVLDNDETPLFCPMCGYPTTYDAIEDED